MAYNTTTLLDSKGIPQDFAPAGAEMTAIVNNYRVFRPQPVRSPHPGWGVGSFFMAASAEPGKVQIMRIISTIEPPEGLGEGSAAKKNPGLSGRGLSGQMSWRLGAGSPIGQQGEQVEDADGAIAVEVGRVPGVGSPRRQ